MAEQKIQIHGTICNVRVIVKTHTEKLLSLMQDREYSS